MILGIGFDLVSIARVEAMLARKEKRALDRLFTEHEQQYALSRARIGINHTGILLRYKPLLHNLIKIPRSHQHEHRPYQHQRTNFERPA